MQVAEPALAFLDVGFELIAAVADPLVPFVALAELGFDKLRGAALDDLGVEPGLELGEQRLLTPDVARFQQSGADRQVAFGIAQAIVDRTGRMPDLKP